MAYVYRHIRVDKNEPFYVGVGSDDKYARARTKSKRSKMWVSIAKRGYEIEIIMDGLTKDDACAKEREFISLYGRKDLGQGTLVNHTNGGEGIDGFRHSIETKKIIGEKTKGIPRTDEVKKKISDANKGRVRTSEHRKKMSEAQKGSIRPAKMRLKVSKSLTGLMANEKSPFYKGRVIVYKNEREVGRYMGIGDCKRKLNLLSGGISNCLLGKSKTHKGYTFQREVNY